MLIAYAREKKQSELIEPRIALKYEDFAQWYRLLISWGFRIRNIFGD